MGINSFFFYENQKFRPQGGPFVYISDFIEGVNVIFFGLCMSNRKTKIKMNKKYIFSFSLCYLSSQAKCSASINYEASRRPHEEAVAPRGAAAHSLGTSVISDKLTNQMTFEKVFTEKKKQAKVSELCVCFKHFKGLREQTR